MPQGKSTDLVPYKPADPGLPALYAGRRLGTAGQLWAALPRALERAGGAGANAAGGGGGIARPLSRFAIRRWLAGRLPAAKRNLHAARQRQAIREGWELRFIQACNAELVAGLNPDDLKSLALANPHFGSLTQGRAARLLIEAEAERIINDQDPILWDEIAECCTALAIRRCLHEFGPAKLSYAVLSAAQDYARFSGADEALRSQRISAALAAVQRELSGGLDSIADLERIVELLPESDKEDLVDAARATAEDLLSAELAFFRQAAKTAYNQHHAAGIQTIPDFKFTHKEQREIEGWVPLRKRLASRIPLVGKRWRDSWGSDN